MNKKQAARIIMDGRNTMKAALNIVLAYEDEKAKEIEAEYTTINASGMPSLKLSDYMKNFISNCPDAIIELVLNDNECDCYEDED